MHENELQENEDDPERPAARVANFCRWRCLSGRACFELRRPQRRTSGLGSVGRLLVGQRLDFVCVRLEGKSPLSCELCKGWRIELSNVSDVRDGIGKG